MNTGCDSYQQAEAKRTEEFGWQISRRGLLATLGMSAAGWLGAKSALAQVVVSEEGKDHQGDILINVFLRGGMDGLSAVAPYGEDAYHRGRPNLRLRSPKDAQAGNEYKVLDLDGFFGLNPAMAAIYPLYKDGKMACLHAVGSGDQTRSHFEAMNAMERGMFQMRGGLQTGWVARHLASTPRKSPTPLRAVALSSIMPDSLRGASHSTTLANLADFQLADPELKDMLAGLYGSGKDVMAQAGRDTLQVIEKLSKIDVKNQAGTYPLTDLGRALQQVATLVRSGVGLEIACLEMGGWDTHVAQGTVNGWLPSYLKDLADALAAFEKDMGPEMKRITMIVQTEFGRRVNENTGLGTDHGRASAMFLIGGSVKGGKVYAEWPGMEKALLDEVGDLRVTTDYRDVLADALTSRVVGSKPSEVFPGWEGRKSGFFRPL